MLVFIKLLVRQIVIYRLCPYLSKFFLIAISVIRGVVANKNPCNVQIIPPINATVLIGLEITKIIAMIDSGIIRVSRSIETGRVWVNTYNAIPAGAPFGGYKTSGIGRETHKVILDHYTQMKNILIKLDENPSGFYRN